jgi:hypothetical protein
MGEMTLDNSAIPGLVAGDMRFVNMSRFTGATGNSYVFITDEQNPITGAGNYLFHAHWGASEGVKITDRSNSKGLTYQNPITTTNVPVVVRYQSNCSDKNTTTHWTSCGLTLFSDGRYWNGPGWWTYWNAYDSFGAPQSAGSRPLYTFVAGGYVFVEGNGGDLMAFKHTGSTATTIPTATPVSTPSPTPGKVGDADGNGKVDGIDYTYWLNNYGTKTTNGVTAGDFNLNGTVDGLDYVLWVSNYGL